MSKSDSQLKAVVNKIASNANTKIKEISSTISAEDIVKQAIKIPGVRIDRSTFLRKEFMGHFPQKVVEQAINECPAAANISRDEIGELAKKVIQYETNKVSGISFAAGLPGGIAMAATIPADAVQYFGFILRVMQELAYLYGFPALIIDEDNISAEVMNELLLFLGVMFGVQEASAGVKVLASTISRTVAKRLASKALTKTAVYPIIKRIATKIGFSMTKQIFANGVSKIVPIIGGIATGGLTYATFKPCANRLKDCFSELNLSDPDEYKQPEPIDVEYVSIDTSP